MKKKLALKRYQVLLMNLHRFSSYLDDTAATCMLLGRCSGFVEALYMGGLIDSDELLVLQELAYNAHEFARRAA